MWLEFFERLHDIVDLPGLSASEKKQAVMDAAHSHGYDDDLSEFLCWWED